MIKVEGQVVRKYFGPADIFANIRVFTDQQVKQLLSNVQINTKKDYVTLILNACIVGYNDQVLPRIASAANFRELEDALYELAVDVNPLLDLKKITLPAQEKTQTELALIEPSEQKTEVEFDRVSFLERSLRKHVIGQDEAIDAVSHAIKKSAVGLKRPNEPMGVFLFVGQTGVGKTELAKALTVELFGSLSKMLRIDCSEYAMSHEYSKLIGSPPGFVGHEEDSLLSVYALKNKSIVVLLDEIEKSSTKLHDLLLQIMDEAQITDAKGRRLDFSNSIVIMTSNVGADEIQYLKRRIGFFTGSVERKDEVGETIGAAKSFFKPEFLNRISKVVVFSPLGIDDAEKIADKVLKEICILALNIPIRLTYESSVPQFIARVGFSSEYGAREIKRTVAKEVEDKLADSMIEGRFKKGDSVHLRATGKNIEFTKN